MTRDRVPHPTRDRSSRREIVMRLLFAYVVCAALLPVTATRADDVKIKDLTISIDPMTFYAGQRNRFPHWGERMDCPTHHDRPAGARDRWIQRLCGEKADQKPVVKQVGVTTSGGSCGYARYAVACVKTPQERSVGGSPNVK